MKSDQAMERETTVFILGAGCSLPHYPLATNMRSRLEEFGKSLEENPAAERLRRLVQQTLGLFERLRAKGALAQTLDDLAWLIHQGTLADNSIGTNRVANDRLVEDAKTAVAAMFLSKERDAVKGGLVGYRNLIRHIFPSNLGTDYRLVLRDTPYRVLTFNYDRLFELAFRVHFPSYDGTDALYCPAVLNGGLYQALPHRVEVDLRRFGFLKLHGSVGLYSYERGADCAHYHSIPDPVQSAPITDEEYFVPDGSQPKSTLIVFPHEKNFLDDYPSNRFSYRFYIPEIWKAARHFAGQAKEIWIVGYSCPKPDFPAWSSLLACAKNCQQIVVWDPCAKGICERISVRLPDKARLLKPIQQTFGEF